VCRKGERQRRSRKRGRLKIERGGRSITIKGRVIVGEGWNCVILKAQVVVHLEKKRVKANY